MKLNDCSNGEMRDMLPDLLNGKLEEGDALRVNNHLSGCHECTEEVQLLRTIRAANRAPKVNVHRITAALPAYTQPRRSNFRNWSLAAAAAVLVSVSSMFVAQQRVDNSVVAENGAQPTRVSLGLVGGLEQLSEENLDTLMQELSAMEASPSANVDAGVPSVFKNVSDVGIESLGDR